MSLFKNKYRVESTRLKGYDYTSPGFYYVTICLDPRKPFFGIVENDKVTLNEYGRIASDSWKDISKDFENIELGEYIIMPDHLHGIVIIKKQTNKTLSNIVQVFKSRAAIKINKLHVKKCSWQKRFYDRIIRDEREFSFVSEYIKNNPLKYELGKEDKEWWELLEEEDKL